VADIRSKFNTSFSYTPVIMFARFDADFPRLVSLATFGFRGLTCQSATPCVHRVTLGQAGLTTFAQGYGGPP